MDVRGNSWRPGSMAARRRAVLAERQRGWSRCRDRLARADTCQRGGSLLGAGPCGPFLAFRRDCHRSTAVLSVEGGVGDRVNEFVTEVGGAIVIRDVAIELDRRERPELHKPPVHRLRHRGGAEHADHEGGHPVRGCRCRTPCLRNTHSFHRSRSSTRSGPCYLDVPRTCIFRVRFRARRRIFLSAHCQPCAMHGRKSRAAPRQRNPSGPSMTTHERRRCRAGHSVGVPMRSRLPSISRSSISRAHGASSTGTPNSAATVSISRTRR